MDELMDKLMKKISQKRATQEDIDKFIHFSLSDWEDWLYNHHWETYNLFVDVSLLNQLPIDFFEAIFHYVYVFTIDDILDVYFNNLKSEYMTFFLSFCLLMDDEDFAEEPIKYSESKLKQFFIEFVRPNMEEIYANNKSLKHFYNLFKPHLDIQDKRNLIDLIGSFPLDMDEETLWTIEKDLKSKRLQKAIFQAKLLEV